MDYQSNSDKDRLPKGRPEKEVKRVVKGEVIERPKTIGRKFKEVFMGGTFRRAVDYVYADVFLPTMRALVYDSITRGASEVIWGRSRFDNRRPRPEGNVLYNRMYDSRRYPAEPRSMPLSNRGRVPDQVYRGEPRKDRKQVNDFIVPTREEANDTIEQMLEILDQYEAVSLADLKAILGIESEYPENHWGWTYLANNVEIRQVREGYLISFPPLEDIS